MTSERKNRNNEKMKDVHTENTPSDGQKMENVSQVVKGLLYVGIIEKYVYISHDYIIDA